MASYISSNADQAVDVTEIHYTIRNNKAHRSDDEESPQLNSHLQRAKLFLSRSAIDIKKFSQYLSGIHSLRSSQKCARSIRVALESAGAQIQKHPVAAADWGATLTQLGFRKIHPEFSNPRRGDIYIIQRTAKHNYGHIAGFTGSEWVSDFKQRSYDVYKDHNIKYEYYRLE
ncbi:MULTISPECIES: CHAP domain-containing protein [unclassified Acinetobacter]|uniref:CHAP domain-containing protein n=1 Tax=unclassified Acinetobacter TaxID=196816 RepID=UPI00293508F7|nr:MULTISPECIES: CHAP domain-containing protein [unclassified Acinetobacter]WOE30530.1 CHAP domain-containing protein [Acinetobacter sp. SAAs470]WOE38721.1 CHAP domain-containing protein [Acinetobacter sp. SAAs474]